MLVVIFFGGEAAYSAIFRALSDYSICCEDLVFDEQNTQIVNDNLEWCYLLSVKLNIFAVVLCLVVLLAVIGIVILAILFFRCFGKCLKGFIESLFRR